MGNKRLFTEKELAFIATYRGYGDGARAAMGAGYAQSNAKQQAHRLLKNPEIRQALEEKQRQIIGQSVKLDAAKLSRMPVQSGQSAKACLKTTARPQIAFA
jgi:phage terminase small subunit